MQWIVWSDQSTAKQRELEMIINTLTPPPSLSLTQKLWRAITKECTEAQTWLNSLQLSETFFPHQTSSWKISDCFHFLMILFRIYNSSFM